MMPTVFPCVPGHEIVGRVVKQAPPSRNSKREISPPWVAWSIPTVFARTAAQDRAILRRPATFTYNSEDKHLGGVTYGGYSDSIVVDEAFALRVSDKLNLAAAAPLLCAGITTYSPMRHWGVTKGKKVGVVGLGGLGHMGVKFAHALGAHTVAFTTSASKKDDALRLGADEVVLSRDANEMAKHAGSFDFILDTVSAEHNVSAYLDLVKLDGTLTMVGASPTPLPVHVGSLLFRRRSLAGSIIGGIRETQEMLDFCAEHGIACDIEMIRIQQINEAYERLLKSDVKYRFVIDMASLK